MISKTKQTTSLTIEATDISNSKNTKSLQIAASKGKTISKTQKEFNRLNKMVASLKKQIEEIPSKKQLINNFYVSDIQTIEKSAQATNIELIVLLNTIYDKEKLAAWRKKKLACIILEECTYIKSAFVNLENEQTETCILLFNKYNLIANNRTPEEQEKEDLRIIANMASNMFGMDFSELENITNENDMINFIVEKMHEAENNHDTTNTAEPTQKKKVTQAQLKEEAQAVMVQKSLREIYTDLVKELHPDRELDETLRKEKEEKMKQITEAYQKKDLSALLLMQINWLLKTDKDPAGQPDDVLKQYNQILQKHITHLTQELDTLQIYNAPFNPVENQQLLSFSINKLKIELQNCKKLLLQLTESLREQNKLLSVKTKKNKNQFIDAHQLINFYEGINDYNEYSNLKDILFDMFFDDKLTPERKRTSKKR